MKNTKNFLKWLDNNILTVLTAILIVVIPLYPKLPLADLIEGYIVRLRAEDIFVAIAALVWIIQLKRKKISLPDNKISKLIFGYIIIGFLSSLSALYITRTVPLETQHVFKLFLHFARRVEYFSLFFIAYSSVKTKKDLKFFAYLSFATLIAVNIYGYGQKYLYWPAFSTMNREFSKGTRLYLTEHSRVMSTFAGHYDLAAYAMIALVALVTALWLVRNIWFKVLLWALIIMTYWTLILTSSRASWGGYMIAITTIAILLIKRVGFWRSVGRWLTITIFSLLVMFTLGDLSERFLQLINNPGAIAKALNLETGYVEAKIIKLKDLSYRIEDFKKGLFTPKKDAPSNAVADTDLAKVAVKSDTPPSTAKPTELPPDVTEEEDQIRKESEKMPTSGGYSENALKYGLSLAIRLDALWPRAIEGFMRNPLLGSGYSTLVKAENTEFTQAESTDNDYLRMLGETGILGTAFFIGILMLLITRAIKEFNKSDNTLSSVVSLSMAGIIIALMINATYIDVFESSKIAYTFWLLAALFIRNVELDRNEK